MEKKIKRMSLKGLIISSIISSLVMGLIFLIPIMFTSLKEYDPNGIICLGFALVLGYAFFSYIYLVNVKNWVIHMAFPLKAIFSLFPRRIRDEDIIIIILLMPLFVPMLVAWLVSIIVSMIVSMVVFPIEICLCLRY